MKSCESSAKNLAINIKNIPGVLRVERDDFFSRCIVVFIDSKTYKGGLPISYDDIPISLFDVRTVLSSVNRLIKVMESNKEVHILSSPSNQQIYDYFIRTSKMCSGMLSL